jgi:hypothetical protein
MLNGASCALRQIIEGIEMVYLIAAAMTAAFYFGFPPVLVAVAGAITTIAFSYWISQHPALLRLGASFVGFTMTHLLLNNLGTNVLAAASGIGKVLIEFGASEKLMLAVAALVMLAAAMVGMFAPRKDDMLSEFIKKHSGQQR